MKVTDKIIVVTGGGNGIGRQLVYQLLSLGAGVAAVDIDAAALIETARLAGENQARLSLHTVNITDLPAVAALPAQVIARHGAVDGIINNAGIIQPFVRLNELDYRAIERVMQVNFYGTLYMVKEFLPHLLQRPIAHIVNVSSMGGFLPVPGQTLYGASKAAVKLLTEGLYSELLNTNVRVTLASPGAIGTDIAKNSGLGDLPQSGDAPAIKTLPPEQAARIILNAMQADRYSVLVGSDARFMDRLYRLNPKGAAELIYKQMKGLLPG